MTTDFRALCEELLAHAKKAQSIAAQDLCFGDEDDGLFGRADTALAEQPVALTDGELLELMPETMWDEFGYAAKVCSDATRSQVRPGIFCVVLNTAAVEYARAVIARWGPQ